MSRFGFWVGLMAGSLLLSIEGKGQMAQYAFRVSFKDKTGSAGIGNPGAFLSQRSLDRRAIQGIAVDSTDQPVSPAYVDSTLFLTGGVLHVKSRWMNDIVVLLTDSTQILQLQGRPWITDVRLVASYFSILHNRPAGEEGGKASGGAVSGFPAQQAKTTGSPLYYGFAWDQTNLVHGDFLHDNGWRGQDKLIAVLDAGFRETDTHDAFDSLWAQNRVADRYNFVRDTDFIFDYSFHGTQVLGTMAAINPGTYVGSAPAARYALYCSEDELGEQPIEMDNMIAAMERADSIGADIIHASLGYDAFSGDAGFSYTYADLDGKTTLVSRGANMAVSKGMFFVASAGNEGADPWHFILTPGDADSALTVGSVNSNKDAAPSSGYGPNSAGVIKPDVMALGSQAALVNIGNGYSFSNGTSYAAPQLAGWAACLWQSRPVTTPYQIRTAINKSAHRYTNPGQQSGYGVPDFGAAYQSLDVDDPAQQPLVLDVWPNPFSDQLWISIDLKQNARLDLSVVDMTGRLVGRQEQAFTAGTQVVSMQVVSSLPRGLYLVRVSGDGFRYARKVVRE